MNFLGEGGGETEEHAYMKPSYETNMLLKVLFDKTVFAKFMISNNFKQNIDDTHSKQP
jgi:hypothetical protein